MIWPQFKLTCFKHLQICKISLLRLQASQKRLQITSHDINNAGINMTLRITGSFEMSDFEEYDNLDSSMHSTPSQPFDLDCSLYSNKMGPRLDLDYSGHGRTMHTARSMQSFDLDCSRHSTKSWADQRNKSSPVTLSGAESFVVRESSTTAPDEDVDHLVLARLRLRERFEQKFPTILASHQHKLAEVHASHKLAEVHASVLSPSASSSSPYLDDARTRLRERAAAVFTPERFMVPPPPPSKATTGTDHLEAARLRLRARFHAKWPGFR